MITKTTNRTRTAVSGVTYDFDFRIDATTDLKVYGIDADGVSTEITTGFTVTFDPDAETGTVTFVSEPSTYAEILRLRSKPYTQGTDVPIREGFSEEDIEGALDSLEMQIQQLKEITDYCVKLDITSVLVNITFPSPEDGSLIAWDGLTGAMKNLAAADFKGETGATGPQGPAGADGADGADGIFSAIASQAEAEAGVENTKGMTALRVAQAISALAGGDMEYSDARFKVGSFTRDMTAAGADVAYTGVGFRPKLVVFYGGKNSSNVFSMFGAYDGTSANTMYKVTAADQWAIEDSGTYCINLAGESGASQDGSGKTLDADGFTLTWRKSGSPSAGTAKIGYIAFR